MLALVIKMYYIKILVVRLPCYKKILWTCNQFLNGNLKVKKNSLKAFYEQSCTILIFTLKDVVKEKNHCCAYQKYKNKSIDIL